VFLQASEDPAIRAALFVVNDLALILVRHPIANGYSCRPLTPEGIDREATAVYAEGAFSAPWKEYSREHDPIRHPRRGAGQDLRPVPRSGRA